MASFDSEWFGTCANTYHEEQKQLVYASRMGLFASWNCAHPPTFDLGGRSVIDIGGGPASLLLKCVNFSRACVLDPASYPQWVWDRYSECGIAVWRIEAEEMEAETREYDEAWIYNVLQHVRDPRRVIANARAIAKHIRLFEWIEQDPYPGHPHRLEREQLDEWLGGRGFVAKLDESGCVGTAYYGVF
jgi:hypothetical protein